MAQNLIYISSFVSGGWKGDYDVGYTIHEGTVYPQGAVITPGAPPGGGGTSGPVTSTFFTGLPVAMRPAVDTAITLYQFHFDSIPTSGPNLFPYSIATTVHTDGRWTFDSLPSDIASGTIDGGFTISGASWPAAGGAGTDTIPWISFAPWLNTAHYTDIDSMIALHNNRVHLKGTIQALVDYPFRVSNTTPALYLPTADLSDPTNESGLEAVTKISAPFGIGDLQAFGAPAGPTLLQLLIENTTPGPGGFWPFVHAGDIVDLTGAGWASTFGGRKLMSIT